jgi:hypothetical protein
MLQPFLGYLSLGDRRSNRVWTVELGDPQPRNLNEGLGRKSPGI